MPLQVQQFHVGYALQLQVHGVVGIAEIRAVCKDSWEGCRRWIDFASAIVVGPYGQVRHVARDQEAIEQFQGLVEVVLVTEVDGLGPIFIKLGLI